MRNFPVTVVDSFYETPDLIRDYALSCEWFKSDGAWPGQRTDLISDLNQNLFNIFCKKIFSIFYDFDKTSIDWSIETSFQKVFSFSEKERDIKNDGWIHKDDVLLSGVIYLNPNPKPGWGTSIYNLKSGEVDDCNQDQKYDHYLGNKINEENHYKQKSYNNNKFIETVRIENLYNRMILFEGGVYHGVPTFYSDDDECRLTQVFFIHKINSNSQFPLIRSKIFGGG